MSIWFRFIIGLLIGAGAILPGISSGVLCVIFGIYDTLIESVLSFFQDIKKNAKFLFPIVIGVGIGIVIFGNVLNMLFEHYPIQTKCAFLGLILGCVPNLFHIANSKKGFRLHYIGYTIISFVFTLILLGLENTLSTNTMITTSNTLFLILSGFVMSAGVVIPGISSTVLLMILGTYETYLNAVSTLNLFILLPMGIGLVFGGLLFLKLIQFFLKKHFSETYYTIIGFVLGSMLILCPNLTFDINGMFSIVIFMVCFWLGKQLETKSDS